MLRRCLGRRLRFSRGCRFRYCKTGRSNRGQISLCGFGRALRTAFCDTPVRLFRRNGIGGTMRAETEAQCQHQWFEENKRAKIALKSVYRLE